MIATEMPTYSRTAPEHPSATIVLVLGLIGVLSTGVTAPFAWYLGHRARKEMAENPGRYADSAQLTAGWVMGMIATICGAVLWGLFIIGTIVAVWLGVTA